MELEQLERRLNQKEDNLDKRAEDLTRREKEAAELERACPPGEAPRSADDELKKLLDQERHKLEQIAGLTGQQAKDELVRVMETEARNDAAHLVKRIEDEAKENANRNAQRILANAIQRNASDYVSETTVSVVLLPNDEMKGRIIGREGRNIRALEMATGVDLIVDDTPEAVILSGFDPFRREIARVALERLIQDGRIHPARIEEVVDEGQGRVRGADPAGRRGGAPRAQHPDLHPELVKLLGKLRFRTSYGQNVLKHSKEVAYLAATMAAELRSTSTSPSAPASSTTSARPSIARWKAHTLSWASICCASMARARRSSTPWPAITATTSPRPSRPCWSRRPTRCQPPVPVLARGARELHQAAGEARRSCSELQGSPEDLCDPGGS